MPSLEGLNTALHPHGWFAEWLSNDDGNFRVILCKPSGGQIHNRFEFDPADPDDNNPWDDEGAVHGFTRVLDDQAVDKALLDLCKACQE